MRLLHLVCMCPHICVRILLHRCPHTVLLSVYQPMQATVNSERLPTSFLAVKRRHLLYLCMLFCHFISVYVCPLTIPFFVHSMLQSESAQCRRYYYIVCV